MTALTPSAAREIVLAALAEVAPDVDAATTPPTATLADLDLDSMDRLDVAASIEAQTGRTVAEGAVGPEATIDGLAAYLAGPEPAG